MPPIFTAEESALIAEWLADHDQRVSDLQAAIVHAQAEYAKTVTEDGIYSKMRQDALDQIEALLQAKSAALKAQDPDQRDRTVEYLAGYPSLGGTNPTAWQITHEEEQEIGGPITVVDYSHSENWDDNAEILSAEDQWTIFYQWKVNMFYGTTTRLNGLDGAIEGYGLLLAAILARDAEFE